MATSRSRCPLAGAVACVLTLLLATYLCAVAVAPSSTGNVDDVHLLKTAIRRCGAEQGRRVELPDEAYPASGQGGPLACSYRLDLHWRPHGAGLYILNLQAHATIAVNSVVVSRSVGEASSPTPRSIDRTVLVQVPDPLWNADANVIDIEALAPGAMSLSIVRVGDFGQLSRRLRGRVLGMFVGPLVVGAIMATLGLCMLLLWGRTGDGLHGYFGAGTLAWGLHTFWTASPWSPIAGIHQSVWWTVLYALFVDMLIIFCIRLAGWTWPRFERVLRLIPLAAAVLLYACASFNEIGVAAQAVRLLLLLAVATGVVAVVRGAIERPSIDLMLVIASGVVSFSFGIHDWLAASRGNDESIFLVPYAGLVFATLVVRMLIDRFAHTAKQLELMNLELEKRVEQQTAELHHAIERMREARDAAESADRAKSRFLALASHDLRQPAHALTLYMATLRSEPLGARPAELVDRMSGSLSALESMFNMLLDVSRIDAGALKPDMTIFPIDVMLRRLAEEFAPQAEAQGLRLALHLPLPASSDVLVRSDRMLVERAVRNLMANAVKYTSHGGLLLACRLRGSVSQPGAPGLDRPRWRVEVWDTGPGIAEADKLRVFEEFFQVGNPTRERAQGLGLGLSIVQRIAKLLDIELAMCSRVGRGSCFALSLPRIHADPEHRQTLPERATDVAGMTVAMIEDDIDAFDAMRNLLENWGCAVVGGTDADEVVTRVVALDWSARLDAVIIDQRLEAGRAGPAEAASLFAFLARTLPLLVVTGESDLAPVRAAGHAFLTKPASPALLRNWLASVRARATDSTGVPNVHASKEMP